MIKSVKESIPENIIHEIRHWQHYFKYEKLRKETGKFSLKGFDENSCIFIHIPKTGGISINKALFNSRGGGHKSVVHYKRIFGNLTFKKYFKFCFVRNPYSRLVSAYKFLQKGGYKGVHESWFDDNLKEYKTFEEFVSQWLNEVNIYKKCHFKPQFEYVCNRNLTIEADFIGRYENLNEDFQEICQILNMDAKLPHFNSSDTKRDWITFYNRNTLKIVEEVYQNDFEIFGYDKISDKYEDTTRVHS